MISKIRFPTWFVAEFFQKFFNLICKITWKRMTLHWDFEINETMEATIEDKNNKILDFRV